MTEPIMTSSSAQPDSARPGMLDVENLEVDELTVGFRFRAREDYRPEGGVDVLVTDCARLLRSDPRDDPLRPTFRLAEPVWRDRRAAAPVAVRSPASACGTATLRIAPTRVERDLRDSLGAFVDGLERTDTKTVLTAIARPVAQRQRGLTALVSDRVNPGWTDGLPSV